jgi:hypothetical protein
MNKGNNDYRKVITKNYYSTFPKSKYINRYLFIDLIQNIISNKTLFFS